MYFFSVLILFSCRNTDKVNVSEPSVSNVLDADGDGFDSQEDCDDSDESIFPDAEEQCDGLDNNCNGAIDEGVTTTFYRDTDGDGYGQDDESVEACEAPDGYILEATDCDDTDLNINPSVDEVCDELDNNCSGEIDEGVTTTFYRDTDGDGYGQEEIQACDIDEGLSDNALDCDDTNADISPEEAEVCDGLDNDCDGVVDESVKTVFYLDEDTDGFGDPDVTMEACTPPLLYVSDNNDCLDTDSFIHPDADEICDELDNNCDGVVDEDSAINVLTWYADTDGDGFGDVNSIVQTCTAPIGYVSDNTDCNDMVSSSYPSALEYCNGVDDNCDSVVDENTAADAIMWYADMDGDGFGDSNVTMIDCEQPANYVVDGTDCDDNDEFISPSATEVCDEEDNDCDSFIDESDASDALAYFLDFDGDGYGDATTSEFSCIAPTGYVLDSGDCDDNDPTLNEADTDGDGYSSCEGDCDDNSASLSIEQGGGCTMGLSCADILGGGYEQGDGVYTIDPDGVGSISAYNVYCDMTIDGGGWTALINPVGSLTARNPNLSSSAVALSGTGSCPPAAYNGSGNGWHAVRGYACGNFTGQFTLSWVNDIGATDVMFIATLQGQQTHTLSVNGINIPYDAFSNAYMKCAFWNANGSSTNPSTNGCWETYLPSDPKVYNSQFSGNLSMVITTGIACSPDCSHGTGFNVQKLFVR